MECDNLNPTLADRIRTSIDPVAWTLQDSSISMVGILNYLNSLSTRCDAVLSLERSHVSGRDRNVYLDQLVYPIFSGPTSVNVSVNVAIILFVK
jgi:hypothetical protein